MAKIITCQVEVLDGSNINIDVNVSRCMARGRGRRGGGETPHPFVRYHRGSAFGSSLLVV